MQLKCTFSGSRGGGVSSRGVSIHPGGVLHLGGGFSIPGGSPSWGVGGSPSGGGVPIGRGGSPSQGGSPSRGVLHPRGGSPSWEGGVLHPGGGFSIRGGEFSIRGVLHLGGSPSRGVLHWGVLYLGGSPSGGGVPCDISHHAFDVTCMLPPHQLRHINSAPAYILLPGHVTCKACWDTHPPPCGQTHICKNITFANYVCGR